MIIMQSTKLGLFKILINFNLLEYDELSTLMVPTIAHDMKSTNEVHFVIRWPIKLNPNQQLFQSIMYMKHDNIVIYDTFLGNWNNNVICNDAIYVVSYIKEVISDKIQWPTIKEWATLNMHIPKFQGCIELLNGTFIEICKP